MPTSRENPCRGRESGCTQDSREGGRCDNCRAVHNAREAARRAKRKRKSQCVVCGLGADDINGAKLTVCKRHREYFRVFREQERKAG
jgi:hypothetical protein